MSRTSVANFRFGTLASAAAVRMRRFAASKLASAACGLVALAFVAGAPAEDITADPAAQKAFGEFLSAYRAWPALSVKASTVVSATDAGGGAIKRGEGETVEITLRHGIVPGPDGTPQRRGVLTVKGYTCWVGDGFVSAIHESNADAYFRAADDGSVYYALTNLFADLPYPDLALAFGEAAPEDAIMQLSPKAPNVVPVSVTEAALDGKPRRLFKLAAEGETIDLVVDAVTGLPASMRVEIASGPFVPEGAKLIYEHGFVYETPDKPLVAEDVAFDPGRRVKADLFHALAKRAEPARDAGGRPMHGLVGKPVPALSLPLLDGGTLDLAALKGRVVVLDFWATWCGPCKAALPTLHRIAGDFKADDEPVSFYTVNVFEQQTELEARRKVIGDFWRDSQYTLPVGLDLAGEAGRAFGITGIPMTVVVRSDGVVHAVHVGFRKEKLIEDVKGAIAALEAPADEGASPQPAPAPAPAPGPSPAPDKPAGEAPAPATPSEIAPTGGPAPAATPTPAPAPAEPGRTAP